MMPSMDVRKVREREKVNSLRRIRGREEKRSNIWSSNVQRISETLLIKSYWKKHHLQKEDAFICIFVKQDQGIHDSPKGSKFSNLLEQVKTIPLSRKKMGLFVYQKTQLNNARLDSLYSIKYTHIDEHHCQQFVRGDLNSNMFQLQCSLFLQVPRKLLGHQHIHRPLH